MYVMKLMGELYTIQANQFSTDLYTCIKEKQYHLYYIYIYIYIHIYTYIYISSNNQ